jgi:septal ring factor EnvC (AmiA/AmiB activator)
MPAAWSAPGADAGGATTRLAAAHDDHPSHDLDDLRRRIRDAQRDLSATEESRSEAADALKKSEQAISEATRKLRELGQEESAAQTTLAQLADAQSLGRDAIAHGQQRLAALLRHQYAVGGDDSLALLLSGGDPGRRARDAQYLKQLAQERQAAVSGLRRDLVHLAEVNQQTQSKADELARTRDARARERARLQQQSAARARLVAELSSRLQAQKRNLQTMERDEKRLTQLVERIARALEERRQQKEKVQRERVERERVQRDKAARGTGSGHERGGKVGDGRSADGESDAGGNDSGRTGEATRRGEVIARIDESAEEGYDTEAFPRMKGRLRLPVTGELGNRFGSPREDSGLNWKGLFIRAPQGREVHAVASGRVVYSDWLRGFGNLLIIDHGAGYMSLYGNNESLFARVGEVVKGGAAVASVGNSGGNPEPGLYFEIRYQSRPFDPMAWVGKP